MLLFCPWDISLTFVRGISTFLGLGRPDDSAYSWAALSLSSVKRVPSTKSASQKGCGKPLKRWNPTCVKVSWYWLHLQCWLKSNNYRHFLTFNVSSSFDQFLSKNVYSENHIDHPMTLLYKKNTVQKVKNI